MKIDPIKKEHEVKGTDIKIELATDDKMERHSEQRGTVLDYGPLCWKDNVKLNGESVGKPWVEIGDKILFSKHAGRFLPGDEWKDYVLMQDQDVIAVLTGELR